MKRISSIEDLRKRYKTFIEFPVAWGEMDAFGHVNNIFYFRYFESARMHYLGLIGALDHLKQHNVGPILAGTDCKFIFPLKYPDELIVGVRVETADMPEDRFEMSYVVWSKTLGKPAALGSSIIVYYDYNRQGKTKVTEVLRNAILKLEISGQN